MIEHLDDLEVALTDQREDHIAGAEPGVDASVDRLDTDPARETLGRCAGPVLLGRVDNVVNSHAVMFPHSQGCP